MAIRYKVDVLASLKTAGYSQTRIRSEKLLGVSVLSKIRAGGLPSWHEMDIICGLLKCQPGDLVEYVVDDAVIPTPRGNDEGENWAEESHQHRKK